MATYVLVHGAYQGGWIWQPVATRLRAAGHTVYATMRDPSRASWEAGHVHEWWNGAGYPLGLAGEDIPLVGRITAVADVFDTLSTKCSYKPAFPLDKCFGILSDGRGTQFDPQVLDGFFAARDEIVAVQISYAEVE